MAKKAKSGARQQEHDEQQEATKVAPLFARIDADLRDRFSKFVKTAQTTERIAIEAMIRYLLSRGVEEGLRIFTEARLPSLSSLLTSSVWLQHATDRRRAMWVLAEAQRLETLAGDDVPELASAARHKASLALLYIADQSLDAAWDLKGTDQAEMFQLCERVLESAIAANVPYVKIDKVRTYNVISSMSMIGQALVERTAARQGGVTRIEPLRSANQSELLPSEVQGYIDRWQEQVLGKTSLHPADEKRLVAIGEKALTLLEWVVTPHSLAAGGGPPTPVVADHILDSIPKDTDLVCLAAMPTTRVAIAALKAEIEAKRLSRLREGIIRRLDSYRRSQDDLRKAQWLAGVAGIEADFNLF